MTNRFLVLGIFELLLNDLYLIVDKCDRKVMGMMKQMMGNNTNMMMDGKLPCRLIV